MYYKFQIKNQGDFTTKLPSRGDYDRNESETQFFDNLKWLTSRETVSYLRLPSLGTKFR